MPQLVPIRYGRMMQSPFAFYRGAAAIMAADLAYTPVTGIRVQACGDCHLLNFGGFATPERNVVFDIDDFDDPSAAAEGRLDLGSVLIPMPEAGQVQVELTEQGVPSAVWVVTPNGRFTVAAYAAPKSAGLWREVATELAESLRKDVPTVAIEDGPWGREVVGVAGEGSGVVRFIGVDGYRWMIRCVVAGRRARVTRGSSSSECRRCESRWRDISATA